MQQQQPLVKAFHYDESSFFPNNVKEVIAKVYVLLINDPIQRKFPLFGDDFSTSFRSFDFRRNTFYVGIESCIFIKRLIAMLRSNSVLMLNVVFQPRHFLL